ncbi:DUF2852 domain-containing protein [Rhodobacteraceae bacterium KMM 6894]|nr:DUF2852 domain-containing protein [Rhodobacteraceae bacterium KMM 6894]
MSAYAHSTNTAYQPTHGPLAWLRRAETWLDARGKGAWIATTVLGFIAFWPVGLALLAYMIWSKRMFSCSKRSHSQTQSRAPHGSSGNSAFDAYRDATLARLQDEQDSFVAFLDRLRQAKDKAEFDQFMTDRDANARAHDEDADDAPKSA